MSELIRSKLDEKSAESIATAADDGVISNDANHSAVIRQARSLIEDGAGHHVYVGYSPIEGPQWRDPGGPRTGT